MYQLIYKYAQSSLKREVYTVVTDILAWKMSERTTFVARDICCFFLEEKECFLRLKKKNNFFGCKKNNVVNALSWEEKQCCP